MRTLKLLKTKWFVFTVMLLLALCMNIHVQAEDYKEENGFYYSIEYGQAKIEGYYGTDPVMRIPTTLGGYPVTGINSVKNGSANTYKTVVQELYIPDTVKYIGGKGYFNFSSNVIRKVRFSSNQTEISPWDCAFLSSPNLETLENTEGITKIAFRDFEACASLKNASFPNVTSIREWAFSGCSSLISADLPKITEVPQYAFSGCSSLKYANMPQIKSIETNGFYGCASLEVFTIPSVCTYIGDYAFSGSGLINVTIPASVTKVGGLRVFENCEKLKTVTIQAPITSLVYRCFANCYALTDIVLPNTLKNIRSECFENCKNLNNVVIPSSVTDISPGVFRGCERLTNLHVYEGTEGEKYAKENGIPYQTKALKAKIALNRSKATLYLTKGFKTTTLKVTKENTTLAVKFKSSNPSVAKVSSSGKITAKKAGKAKITVTCGTLKKTCTITVKKPKIKLKTKSVTLKKGKEKAIKLTVTPAKGAFLLCLNDTRR